MPSHLDEMIASLEAAPGVEVPEVPVELSQELVESLCSDDDERIDPVIKTLRDRIETLESACETLRGMVKQLHEGGRQLACINQQLHTLLTPEQAATVKLTGINGCACDFCAERKKHEENWCPRCAKVRMDPTKKNWENMDVCDECEKTRVVKPATVFHTVTWIESPTTISMNLGHEGAITDRWDAQRMRSALQLLADEELVTQPEGTAIRVGILEIAPPVSGVVSDLHIVCANVDAVIDSIQRKIDEVRANRPNRAGT